MLLVGAATITIGLRCLIYNSYVQESSAIVLVIGQAPITDISWDAGFRVQGRRFMQYLKDDMYPERAQGSNTIEEFILGVQGLLYF